MRFKDKVVLVTGGGNNIGAAIAYAFGAEGAAVALDDIDENAAQEMVEKIQRNGGRAMAWYADVGDSSAVPASR